MGLLLQQVGAHPCGQGTFTSAGNDDLGLRFCQETSQRRLAEEHTSFRAVKDSLRRDMAIARLNSSQVPLAVLADELGFSDSAAFQRAFKGWTGVPPGSYRHPEQG